MEIRIETMLCVWDEKLPSMLFELINLITLVKDEGELRESVRKFAEINELDKFFIYGYGSHHLWVHQRYISDPERILPDRLLSVHF